MSYGLFDADLQFYPIPFYNLELMKLSTYYKRKREIVSLAPSFTPNLYKNFIVRQDFDSPMIYPFNADNVVFGGRAFDGGMYKSYPEEIEICTPDKSLYSRIDKHLKITRKNSNAINTMKRAEHLRLSLDGKTIWENCDKQLVRAPNAFGLIFHDYNLNEIEGIIPFLKDFIPYAMSNSVGRRIGMKFPVQIYEEEDLVQWLSLLPMGAYYSLHYNNLISNDLMPRLKEIRQESAAAKQVSIDISKVPIIGSEGEYIHRIFRMIINLRSQRLAFPLIYNENVFSDEWKPVMRLINRYNHHIVLEAPKYDYFPLVEPYETMFSYCRHMTMAIRQKKEEILKKENLQKVFQFVRENNYDLFKDFYEYRGEEIRK